MASETKNSLPRVMTVKELSEYLRVHPSTVYKLLRRGDLPGFRIGTDWRFNAEVIDRWCLERNMTASGGGTFNQCQRRTKTASAGRSKSTSVSGVVLASGRGSARGISPSLVHGVSSSRAAIRESHSYPGSVGG
jgi:excisionase family DNA binding protein